MPLFVLMTRLRPGAVHDAAGRRTVGKEWLHKVKAACPDVRFVAHYALLGQYDFMDIYEAPGIEDAHRVALLSRAEGAVSVESWPALPYDRYLEVLEDVRERAAAAR